MINGISKEECCGCSACVHFCPKQCIKLVNDEEGFLYPQIDASKCINCGVCRKKCTHKYLREQDVLQLAFSVINKNEIVRTQSSSGGFFSWLAENTIRQGGLVFGCRFDEKWNAIIDYSETIEGLNAFRGSKYVQAALGDSYEICKKKLDEGIPILFSGTPCQITGLINYLGKVYMNLTTVEVACHGVPSPKVWQSYINEVKGKFETLANEDFFYYARQLKFKIFHDENTDTLVLRANRHKNDYTNAFIQSSTLRPSCYKCNYKNKNSASDFTIADFWGVQKIQPEMEDGKGTSLVIVNTDRGIALLKSKDLICKETDLSKAVVFNPAIIQNTSSCLYNINRNWNSTTNIVNELRNSLPPNRKTIKRRIIDEIKEIKQIFINKKHRNEVSNVNQLCRILKNDMVELVDVNFRDKYYGWKQYCFSITLKIKRL